MDTKSLQDRYAPGNRCFGCGPANDGVVEASIEANGKITATCRGTFVAVKEGHPAYHRW